MGDKKPKSPCVKRCRIDRDSGLCVGCQRTRGEISNWKRLSAAQRAEVLQSIELRRASATATGKRSQPRKTLSKALCRLLADTHVLALKAHGLRWNLEGPLSVAVGPLLDEQRVELGAAADQLAQRIRELEAPVPDSVGAIRRLASLQRASKQAPNAKTMIRQLARDQAAIARSAHAMLVTAHSAEDGASAELLALRAQAHERAANMLRALTRQKPAPRTS